MRRVFPMGIFLLASVAVSAVRAYSQESAQPLRLAQTIPMPGVQGRMDHLGVDVKGKRLFAAALGENQNTVEVIDLKAGKRIYSIPGQSKPQGVFYSSDFKRLFVANGTDGTCRIFRGNDFKLIDSLALGTNANHVGYDPTNKYLYVGIGIPNSKAGALAIIDTRTNKHIGDIQTEVHPGGVKFEKSGPRIFVTLTATPKIGVVDREQRTQVGAWDAPVPAVSLAIDPDHHRVFAGTRTPPTLVIFDSDSGKQIAQLEGVAGIDDLWYDAAHRRIYATGGRDVGAGFVYVYRQTDPDHYDLLGKVTSEPNAQTSIWVPQFNRLYVSASSDGSRDAEILVYEPQ